MPNRVRRFIPIVRIFSEEKAREFYIDYIGFHVNWEYCFEPNSPLIDPFGDGIQFGEPKREHPAQ